MYGTSDKGFLKIDPLDAKCSYVKVDEQAGYPNSLAFVPLGTVDPAKETLVGYQYDPSVFDEATVYAKIDLATGAITRVGELNDPNSALKFKSSGDLIALIRNGNKAYLTVRTVNPDAGTGNDYLAEVDPTTGRIKVVLGETKKERLYGFGQWAGTGYAFSSAGEILEIDMQNGASKLVTTLTVDGGAGSWFGAGVSTDSPTKP
jgi:hypothetical protein